MNCRHMKFSRKKFNILILLFIFLAVGSCKGSCKSGSQTTGGGGNAAGAGAGNTACNFRVAASLYNGGTSGDGEQTRVTDPSLLIQTANLVYLGAFRLPGDEGRAGSFSYGGNAMTYYPTNNSLFITGHDRLAYGEFPGGSQVAEVTIPNPVISRNVADLPTAAFIQNFADVSGGLFNTYDEIPRIGMAYVNTTQAGEKIYFSWGQHFQESEEDATPSHARFNPNLSAPNTQGAWYAGNRSLYSTNGYMFEIAHPWADTNVGGRYLATGRYRDGGWSGQGPSLYAIAPWLEGNPPANCTQLDNVALLQYATTVEDANLSATMNNYQHPDEWEGGAWLTTADGRSAVIFAGTKGTGNKYWYGWVNPAGAEVPCIETEYRDQYTTCRYANGNPCPNSDLGGCSGHTDYRGWWSARFDAQIIFYDPANLAAVAGGTMRSYAPQPYATLDIDDRLFLQAGVEEDMLGTGQQRRYRLGDTSFDRTNRRIFVLELFADGTKPVVHVWRVD